MYKILVLLSTYNGEKFLSMQIDSILMQLGIDVSILVRDDGSTDSTLDILKKYCKLYQNISLIEGKNVGFVRSFSELVHEASKMESFDFYAFADQDDIWYENKLVTGARHLSELPEISPNLFGSNSDIIDQDNNKLRPFYKNNRFYTPANLCYETFVQGCSMLFNKEALKLFNDRPPKCCWHDRWMLMICASMGNVIYNHARLFGYRVHSNNTLMANSSISSLGFMDLVSTNIKNLLNRRRNTIESQFLDEFIEAFNNEIPDLINKFIHIYLSYKTNIYSKLYMLLSKDFCPVVHKFYPLAWILLKIEILFNKK